MTGQPNGPKRIPEHLEELTIEQLEELLRTSVELSDDGKYTDAVIDAIARRERENPTGRLPDVDEAWKSFQENFNREEGAGLSLYPDDGEEQPEKTAGEPRKRRRIRWRSFAVAAVLFLIFAVAVAPPALGYRDFFTMVGHWNESIFSFFNIGREAEPSTGPEEVSYDSLEEALEANGVTTPVVPRHMPDGYEAVEIEVKRFPEYGRTDFNALYKSGDLLISMHVTQKDEAATRRFEKDENFVEEYKVNDTVHYISTNNDKLWAVWYVDNLECSLQGELSTDEIKAMIDSIYKGER